MLNVDFNFVKYIVNVEYDEIVRGRNVGCLNISLFLDRCFYDSQNHVGIFYVS